MDNSDDSDSWDEPAPEDEEWDYDYDYSFADFIQASGKRDAEYIRRRNPSNAYEAIEIISDLVGEKGQLESELEQVKEERDELKHRMAKKELEVYAEIVGYLMAQKKELPSDIVEYMKNKLNELDT